MYKYTRPPSVLNFFIILPNKESSGRFSSSLQLLRQTCHSKAIHWRHGELFNTTVRPHLRLEEHAVPFTPTDRVQVPLRRCETFVLRPTLTQLQRNSPERNCRKSRRCQIVECESEGQRDVWFTPSFRIRKVPMCTCTSCWYKCKINNAITNKHCGDPQTQSCAVKRPFLNILSFWAGLIH